MADNAASDKDWLGYDAYAASLWRRIQQEFARHEGASKAVGATPNRLPTGDPLVVGVYGEWGAGKTRLLELVHDKVHHQALQVLGQRALDPQAYDKELSITLPVWFHPWKYEHETTLAVPLLMHISDALRVYLKDGQTFTEATTQALELAKSKGGEGWLLSKFEPKATIYPGVGHNSWDKAYSDPDLPRWFLELSRLPR